MKSVFEFVSTNVLSGLENVVINICTLVGGINFTYVSPSGPIDKYLDKYHINHIVINALTPWNVRRVIKEYHPDIVHGHDVKASLSLALNSSLCHRNNIKIISELHNDDPRMWRYSLRSILYAVSSFFYDQIVVVSNAIKQHYIFYRLINKKIVVIPNVVNIYRINNKYLNCCKFKKEYDCIFLGRLVNQKNPIEFVNIINQLKKSNKNISAIIIGDGILYNKVKNYIQILDLSNNIEMLGFKSNPYKYLSKSKICVVPSKFEGFGLVALESLIVGTPVFAYPTGGLLNIVTDKCGGFAKNPLSFSKKIKDLFCDKRKYELFSSEAIKRSRKINKIKLFVSGYKKIYR